MPVYQIPYRTGVNVGLDTLEALAAAGGCEDGLRRPFVPAGESVRERLRLGLGRLADEAVAALRSAWRRASGDASRHAARRHVRAAPQSYA
ncbi:hypothetical protein B7760_02585 [Burkholderia glumae]|nr:hypothetical protein B7760_02585 [Burkholderia glumae]